MRSRKRNIKLNVNTGAVNLQRRSKKRLACTPGNPEVIDIDSLPDIKPKGKNAKWIQTSHYTLNNMDRDCLVNPLAWLNDRIIDAAQALARKQFQVSGFQDTCLGMSMAFEIQRQPFVQILHDGHGHWLTISSISGKPGNRDISVYDSMYPSVGSYTKKADSCYCMLQREDNHPQHEECADASWRL